MNEILLSTVIDKVDAHEKKIDSQEKQMKDLKEQVHRINNNAEILSAIKTGFDKVHAAMPKQSFMEKEFRQLRADIVCDIELRKLPVKKEIIPYSYAIKAIWIAAALFLILCLMSAVCWLDFDSG